MAALKCGKKPARAGAVKFQFQSFFSAPDLPVPPLVFGKVGMVREWGMLANDTLADCVPAGAAHETMQWHAEAGLAPPVFTDRGIIGDYAAISGYVPGDSSTDQGSDMQKAAEYRRTTGILDAQGVRHKIDAYVALRAGSVKDLALATYLFGAVGVGLQLPDFAMDQFDHAEPWTTRAVPTEKEGHYVTCIGRNSHGDFICVTWGRLQAMSTSFLATYMDEGIAYLSLERLRNSVSPRGYDEAALRAALAQL